MRGVGGDAGGWLGLRVVEGCGGCVVIGGLLVGGPLVVLVER